MIETLFCIAIGILIGWIGTIHIDLIPICQPVSIGVGIVRIRSVYLDFIVIVQAVAI